MSIQAPPSTFMEKTMACIRAYDENTGLDDERMSELAKNYGLTAEELTGWRALVSSGLEKKEASKETITGNSPTLGGK
jgi:hypothetical protein